MGLDASPGSGTTGGGGRVLRLAGADNVRDLGGLPARDGRITRRGRIFRGELLPSLLDEDVETLVRRAGLRTVVDLRTRAEIRHHPGDWLRHGVAWVNAPLRLGGFGPVPDAGDDHVEGYIGFLMGRPQAIVLAAETLMADGSHPALFHCAAGKDRTGVICALLLDVLGVEREAIGADYALTGAGLPGVFRRLVGLEPYRGTLAGADPADHIPHAETITAFLDQLDARSGGAEAWLVAHGVDPSLIAGFRAVMLAEMSDG